MTRRSDIDQEWAAEVQRRYLRRKWRVQWTDKAAADVHAVAEKIIPPTWLRAIERLLP
jgi:hypothetical protein